MKKPIWQAALYMLGILMLSCSGNKYQGNCLKLTMAVYSDSGGIVFWDEGGDGNLILEPDSDNGTEIRSVLLKDSTGLLVGKFLPYINEAIISTDTVCLLSDNQVLWRRSFRLREGETPKQVKLTMDYEAAYTSSFSLIPGISWNGNTEDPGNVYHGFSFEDIPWSFASHRTLIPGATYSEGSQWSSGMFLETSVPPYGLSCSMIPSEGKTIHRLIIPEEELPKRVLIREWGLSEGRANVLILSPDEIVTVSARIVVNPVIRPRTGYRYMLDAAWDFYYQGTTPRLGKENLRQLAVRYVKESLWDEQHGMFHLALTLDTTQNVWLQTGGFSIGWCGRNGELANGLIADYFETGDTTSLRMALRCLDTWEERVNSANSSGDPFAPYYGIARDANTLADGATAFLKAYKKMKSIGEKRNYLDTGLGICNAALEIQKEDGQFSGPVSIRGSIGASLIPPLITAWEITDDKRYLHSAIKATGFYMNMLYSDGYLWGGALDTRSIDKESVNPLLAGTIRLYEITRDTVFLRMAEDAAYYLAAWQITQSIPNVPGSLLDEIGYESFGGTSVATVHMCADNFALACVPYLLRLSEHTSEKRWAERAKAIWDYSTQGISQGDMVLQGFPARPAGSQDETVNYTDWGYDFLAFGMDRNNPRGAGQYWLVGWAHAYRMTILSESKITQSVDKW